MKKIILAGIVMLMAILACGTPAEEWQVRGWTVTPSPASSIILPTQTPYIIQITNTPEPPTATLEPTQVSYLCVVAIEAVYLRPSPNTTYLPIDPLLNGYEVIDTGSRDGNWAFVKYGEQSGWVNLDYLGHCN